MPSTALANPAKANDRLNVTSTNDTGSPNPLTNMDGFGIGWWSDAYETFENGVQGRQGARPTVYKNVRPPLNDLVLKSLARESRRKLSLHISALVLVNDRNHTDVQC